MEAGEVVYQGREGTGGAQVFNFPKSTLADYVLRQRQNEAMVGLQNRRLEQQMMNYRNSEIQRWETGNKFDEPSPYYKRPIQKDMSDYRQQGRELLNQGYDNNSVRMMTEDHRNLINERIAKSQKADKLYRDQTTALGTMPNRDRAWVQGHLMNKLYSHDEDVDKADFNSAQDALQHPRAVDFGKSVKLATEDIKNQIALSQIDPTIRDSGLGKYMIIDKGRARFGYTDSKGKMVPGISDELVQHVIDRHGEGENNDLAKSIKWQMAKESVEHDLGHAVDEHLDEPKIMDAYKVMNDPNLNPALRTQIQQAFKTRLYDSVKKELKQAQQQSEETVVHGLGQYPGSWTNPNTTKPEDYDMRDEYIRTLQQPFGEGGTEADVSPEAEQALGSLVGAKYGNKVIVAPPQPIKAGQNTGAEDEQGNPVEDAKPYDRYLITLASGTGANATTETQEINLSDGNYGLWNDLLNTSPNHKKLEAEKLLKHNESKKAKTPPASVKVKIKGF